MEQEGFVFLVLIATSCDAKAFWRARPKVVAGLPAHRRLPCVSNDARRGSLPSSRRRCFLARSPPEERDSCCCCCMSLPATFGAPLQRCIPGPLQAKGAAGPFSNVAAR